MHIVVTKDHTTMSQKAARLIADLIQQQPTAALVVATGNTPLQAYQELASLVQQEHINVSSLQPFQLDEYVGVAADDPRSLYGWSKRAFLDPLQLPAASITRLRGDLDDTAAACRDYDRAVHAAGGFELAILGLGPNGHLGFNEPPTRSIDPTRQVTLTPASLASNAAYWGEQTVPEQALTCGMNHLLAARHIFLLVSGAHKREILWQTVKGPVTEEIPSSYLQQIANITIIADHDAWPNEDEIP
ncbi:glucosamine-6-phosphate deaminase [Dictyobacter alpinus]|uniref:Glucosamine-6-phosphate deaminase n=1 Tax=Dictyobacter alpinus TaxID=2014873 RepID=A0A402BFV4_9CHLR|nr:glucosamine-6-phosphate deaminase [Dictyobacter alpinus]GCE30273.1 glucosamine-6-phosphate deaminase [Dictyobacter alpinus]